ncbi:MAG: glycosyltransferase family 39 protein [Chloroflexi bacterium]|nr:glycosyltransferase family 39 protein [Chloroflexota bacterium]
MTLLPKTPYARSRFLPLTALLLLAFWLGARGLNADGFWVDEVWSLRAAGGPGFGPLSLPDTWQRIAVEDAWQAPGYYLLLNIWGRLAGWSELATRTLSLLLAVLSTAMMYRLARGLHSPLAGLAAALALATSVFYVNFYTEARGYTLYVFLTALCIWSYWRLIRDIAAPNAQIPHTGVQTAFVLSVAGLLYTHYFAALTVVVLGLYHLLIVQADWRHWRALLAWPRWRNRAWWRVGGLAAAGLLLFVPWLNVLLFATRLAQQFPRYTLPPDVMIHSILSAFSNNNVLFMLVLACAALPLSAGRARAANRILLAWFLVIGWFVISLSAAYVLIMGEVRYFMGLWPPLALLAGMGAAHLAQRGVPPAALLTLWLAVNLWSLAQAGPTTNARWNGWDEPWRELAAALAGQPRAGDTLFYQLQEGVNAWYQQDVANYYLRDIPVRSILFEAMADVPPAVYVQRAQDAVMGATRVWLVVDFSARPWRMYLLPPAFTESGLSYCGTVAGAPVTVDLFVNLPLLNAAPTVSYAEPAQNGVIGAALLDPLPAQATNSLYVNLGWWQDASVPRQRYSAALHITDSADNLVAQGQDYGLPYEATACRYSVISVADLPPGDYTLRLVVYDWQSSARLSENASAAERFALGTFAIPTER